MKKIVRHIPFVLAVVTAGLAIKSAVDYKNELDRVLEGMENTLAVPPEVMIKVEDGKALVYWVDEKGDDRFLTTENSLVKNL